MHRKVGIHQTQHAAIDDKLYPNTDGSAKSLDNRHPFAMRNVFLVHLKSMQNLTFSPYMLLESILDWKDIHLHLIWTSRISYSYYYYYYSSQEKVDEDDEQIHIDERK